MQWAGGRRSSNIEDRRGVPVAAIGGIGGLIVLLLALFLGVDPSNKMSVRLELQADCLSGVWASHNRSVLDPGDIDEGALPACNTFEPANPWRL